MGKRKRVTFFVIQPLKRQLYELPPIKLLFSQKVQSCGLGFDDSTNTYKMVCVLNKGCFRPSSNFDMLKEDLCIMVHDLGTDSWRYISETPPYPIDGAGVFGRRHGCLHWLNTNCSYLEEETTDGRRKVICFDMRKETFGTIDDLPPHPPRHVAGAMLNQKLVDLGGGEVGLFCRYQGIRSIELWVLKQKAEWAMHFRHRGHFEEETYLKVLGYWNKEGDILLEMQSLPTSYLQRTKWFVYDLKSGDVKDAGFHRGDVGTIEFQMYCSSLISIKDSVVVPYPKKKRAACFKSRSSQPRLPLYNWDSLIKPNDLELNCSQTLNDLILNEK